jgi:hypothetical protein
VLVVLACQHYASQLALPTSQRRGSVLPRSHDEKARKAFEKATKPVLPGSYRELGRVIAREARAHDKRIAALEQQTRPEAEASAGAIGADVEPVDDVDDDELGDEDLEEQQAA